MEQCEPSQTLFFLLTHLLYAIAPNPKHGHLDLSIQTKIKQLIQRYNAPIFVITKLFFLIWTVSLAGALDQLKSQLAQKYYDHLAVYIIFWILITCAGLLFIEFWKVKNLKEIEVILEKIHLGVMYPLIFIHLFMILIIVLFVVRYDTAALVLMGSIIVFCGLGLSWWNHFKKIKVIDSVKSSFTTN